MAPHDDARQRLTVELETLALRALRASFDDVNSNYFGSKLLRPQFQLMDGGERLGCWIRAERRLAIARRLLIDHGWAAVVEVLKHEMAHQFVDEVLRATDESAHGPSFRRACEERGIDGGPSGLPRATTSSPSPILDRIAKLLSLAQSSNEHEAQAAMNAAQRLMLKHNLEHVHRNEGRAYSYRHLGKPTGRVSEAERTLATILSDHFFVDVIWVSVWRALEGKRGSVLEVVGSVENLEMAVYVHTFLSETSERLWREHKRESGVKRDRDRKAYLAGVMAGFRDKLAQQAKRDEKEGLVWVGDSGLAEYFKVRHPRIRWTRHLSSRGSEAHKLGREAGRNIVLHRGVTAGSGGGRKLLTS